MKTTKKRLFTLILCMLVVFALCVLVACENEEERGEQSKKLDHITINTESVTTEFEVGDELTYAGLEVTAHYDDETSAKVTTGYTVVANHLEEGKLTVLSDTATVSYTEEGVTKSATYGITVTDPNGGGGGDPVEKKLDHITLKTEGVKTEFNVGEELSYAGLEVTAHYDDETSAVVTGYRVTANNLEDGKLTLSSDTATVSYTEGGVTKDATYDITVTDPNAGGGDEQGDPIYHAATQGEAEGKKDAWSYFIDAGATDVTVSKCEILGSDLSTDNKITIEYSYSGPVWTAFNLCYPLSAGKPSGWEVTFTFKSSVAGQLTIVGGASETFDIQIGNNTITKNFDGALLWLRFGGVGQSPLVGSFEIMGIQIKEIEKKQLEKPSFTYEPSTGVITINDQANAGKVKEYKLNFYQGTELKGSTIVVSGAVVEPAGLEVGSYTARLVAVGDGVRYTDSEESTDEATITVSTLNTKVPLKTGDITYAQSNKLEWVAWIDGGLVSANECVQDTETGEITIDFSYIDSINKPWYGMRLLYAFEPTVHIYNYIKLTITVETACTIKIAEEAVELHEGANEIYVSISKTGAVCSIAFGCDDTSKNFGQKFVLSNIEFTDEAPAE